MILAAVLLLDSNLRLTVTQYTVSSPMLPAGFQDYRIVQLSDLHTMEFGPNNKRLVKKVADLDPHMIALTGDYIESAADLPVVAALVSQLSDIAPVYYSSGNHDWASGAIPQLRETIEEHRGTYLSGRHQILERSGDSMVLIGLEDPNSRADLPTPDKVLEDVAARFPNACTVVLAHRNDFPEKYPDLPCDVILSGHGHGGLIRLPFVGGLIGTEMNLFPTYDAGVFPSGRYQMVVSRGLGGAPFYPRLLNNPEIVLVTLEQK